jgi:NAD(P)-dependent dehydrogenase (short-subunit alcohol dehydrogenase family)
VSPHVCRLGGCGLPLPGQETPFAPVFNGNTKESRMTPIGKTPQDVSVQRNRKNGIPGARAVAALACASVLITAPAGAQARAAAGAEPQERKVVLVTGSTDGLGREVALRLAATGAHVIVHGRNRERGAEVVAQIEREGKGSARFYRADFASLAEVRTFAEQILRDYDRLDILINNAGIARIGQEDRQLSADGQELHFAVNYLSGFLLTRMLLPRLRSSAPSRIINVSSLGQAPIDFDDITLERGYSTNRAYGQSKLAQIMFTFDLARELEGTGVTAFAVHPATFMDTHMITSAGLQPRSTVGEGADAVMHLVTAAGLESGRFFDRMTPARANAQASDEAAREKLRALSVRLTGAGG